jgi:hypothetical protein
MDWRTASCSTAVASSGSFRIVVTGRRFGLDAPVGG